MNNKGYSLVELVITMVISAVVMTIVISFLATNSKSYQIAGNMVKLQMESQSVMNQLYDLVVESNWVELVEIDANEKALMIYNQTGLDIVYLDKSDKQLYYIPDCTEEDAVNPAALSYTEEENLMADYIEDIHMDPTDGMTLLQKKQLSLRVDFQIDTDRFSVERNIKLRNEPVVH